MGNGLRLSLALAALGLLAIWLLRQYAWRAVLCLFPSSLKVEPEGPAGGVPIPTGLSALSDELLALGFVALGSHREKAWLRRAELLFDFCHPTDRAYASVFRGRDGRPGVLLLSRVEGEAFALTANQRRPAKEIPGRYLSGALEVATLDRVFKAHQRRAQSLGAPLARCDQEGFFEARQAWFEGPGRRELRAQNLPGLLWTVGTLGIVGAAVFGR